MVCFDALLSIWEGLFAEIEGQLTAQVLETVLVAVLALEVGEHGFLHHFKQHVGFPTGKVGLGQERIEGVCDRIDPENMCVGGSHCVACHLCKKEGQADD